jgi:formamidopyrimidine-DNA glycosylase
MPELPEIANRAREMQEHLTGRIIAGVDVFNEHPEAFCEHISGAVIRSTTHRGKWILSELDKGWLLFNLGMGGELLLVDRANLPVKYRLVFDFTDGDCLSVNFWWVGYSHFCSPEGIKHHLQVSKLGKNALEVTTENFAAISGHRKTAIKTLLLDQTCIAGIGNAYIHDILFLARLHPLRPANNLSAKERGDLIDAIHRGLEPSLAKGGAFQFEDILVGYREGQPCPECSTPIMKIKTGSTSSFICAKCQI